MAEPLAKKEHVSKEIAVVTGGNAGIGFEIARQLLRDHGDRFHVIIGSRTLAKGQDAVSQLKQEGHESVQAVQLDVTEESSVAAAAKVVGDQFGRVDVLHVNVCLLALAHAVGVFLPILFSRQGSCLNPRARDLYHLVRQSWKP